MITGPPLRGIELPMGIAYIGYLHRFVVSRRSFFRGLLAAAATVVARAYVPSALVKAAVPVPKHVYVIESTPTGGWPLLIDLLKTRHRSSPAPVAVLQPLQRGLRRPAHRRRPRRRIRVRQRSSGVFGRFTAGVNSRAAGVRS